MRRAFWRMKPADDLGPGPLLSIAGVCRGAGGAGRSGARARRRRARQPLRRPGGDGADPRRRQGRLLLRAGIEPARSSDRGPLSETLARHGGPLSRRNGGGGHHPDRRGYRPSALPRRRNSSPRRIDRPCAYQDGKAASPALRRRGDRRWRAGDRRASDRLRLWRGARGRLVVGRGAAKRNPCRPRACVHCSHLGL